MVNSALRRGAWSSEGLAPCIHGCEWSVSSPRPPYPGGKSAWYVLCRRMGGQSCGSDAAKGRSVCCMCREPNCNWADRSLVLILTSEEPFTKNVRSIRRRVGEDVVRYDAGARANSMGESIMRSAFIHLPGRHVSTSGARD